MDGTVELRDLLSVLPAAERWPPEARPLPPNAPVERPAWGDAVAGL
jgi:hypothetical protein